MNQQKLLGKKFIIYTPELNFKSGGNIVLHKLAKDLIDNGCKAMLYVTNGKQYENIFCNSFATLEDVDDTTIVVYPEIVERNPLNAKNVVRWILCDLGVHCGRNIYTTWGNDDLVFHFSTFNDKNDPHLVNLLYTLWIDPKVTNKGLPRSGSCYLFKKAPSFHKNIKLIHPKDSIMVDNCTNDEIIDIFNQKEYFYCYDPYTFYDSMAALCGCIPIVYPLEGVSKLDWLKSKSNFQAYLDKRDNMSGLAYGVNDIQFARDTLNDAWKEKMDEIEFGKKTVVNFIGIVDSYFFKDKKDYQLKTVGNMVDLLGWNIIEDGRMDLVVRQNKVEINNLKKTIQQKNQEVNNLSKTIHQKNKEIDIIKTSKFWRLRDIYLKIKIIILKK